MPKIYTKTGDQGETGLWGGARVPKDHPRVAAYGDVDELNAALGLVRGLLAESGKERSPSKELERIQGELFELGAELAADPTSAAKAKPRLGEPHVKALERSIDAMEKGLPALKNFILPGGSPEGAALHLARTVCRRAERSAVALAKISPVSAEALRYLNRLSDYLFVLARSVNRSADEPETPWRPR